MPYLNRLSRDDALHLLKDFCKEDIISHSLAVSGHAKSIAEDIKDKGYDIDVDFVEVAALLHDIGRCRTHGAGHGIEGARILRDIGLEKYANVCERHIGAGLTSDDARSLGLPDGNYMPVTLEEKVVAHADNLAIGPRIVEISDAVDELKKKLGENHLAVQRVKELNDFIECLCKNREISDKVIIN